MSTFARIVNDTVQDVIDFDPVGRFHVDIASLYVQVPDHVRPNATLMDGVWVNPPEPAPPTAEQIAAQQLEQAEQAKLQRAQEIRQQRNALLAECDWTQLADAPVDKAAWAAYRQALRDIPAQQGFPLEVQWPVQPE